MKFLQSILIAVTLGDLEDSEPMMLYENISLNGWAESTLKASLPPKSPGLHDYAASGSGGTEVRAAHFSLS